MSLRKSITLISNTGSAMNVTSDKIEGDAYYGFVDGLHTVQAQYNQFVGRFRVQATLVIDPTESDWFDITPEITIGTAWNPLGYVQFNANEPSSISEAYTFRGNFIWLRCKMDRAHVADGETYDLSYGQVDRVLFSA